MPIPDAALGAVIAATVAGSISLLGLIIAKEQKVSDFRQAWIDALRGEIASLIAHVNALHAHLSMLHGLSPQDVWSKAKDDYVGANRSVASIRLRLNPNEALSMPVLQRAQELEEALSPPRIPDYTALLEIEKELVIDAQALLKAEWTRVREGERIYRWSKRTALGVIVAGLVFALYALATVDPQNRALKAGQLAQPAVSTNAESTRNSET